MKTGGAGGKTKAVWSLQKLSGGRVIDADTRLVVVDPSLHERINAREQLSARELLIGSVQIWAKKTTFSRWILLTTHPF